MKKGLLTYHLCPTCGRATPAKLAERHCPKDGSRLLKACPTCKAAITTPYARYCTHCGQAFLRTTLEAGHTSKKRLAAREWTPP